MRELHTERLLLRTPRERDAAEIMAIRNSAFVMKNNVMKVLDKEQMVHLIHREIDYENTWYIERKEDGALLGMIAAEEDGVRFDVRSRCLSYYLGEQYTRQGQKAKSATTCSFRYCGRNISRRKNNFTKKLDLEYTLSCKI